MGNLCLEIIQWRQVCQGIWTSLPHIAVDWIHVLCVRVLVKWYVMYKFLSLSQVSQARLRALQSWHASSWALRQFHLASEPSCSFGVFRMKNKVLSVVTTLPQQGFGMILKAVLPICYFWIYTDVRVCVCACRDISATKNLAENTKQSFQQLPLPRGTQSQWRKSPFCICAPCGPPSPTCDKGKSHRKHPGRMKRYRLWHWHMCKQFSDIVFCLLVHCMISVQTSRSESGQETNPFLSVRSTTGMLSSQTMLALNIGLGAGLALAPLEASAFDFCESSAAGFVAGTPSVVISTEDSSYCIFALLGLAASALALLGLDPIGADGADSAADPWTPTFASSSESDNTTIGT